MEDTILMPDYNKLIKLLRCAIMQNRVLEQKNDYLEEVAIILDICSDNHSKKEAV